MYKLDIYKISYIIQFLDEGEKAIINLIHPKYKFNYKLDIDGFINNEKMLKWYCFNFNFPLDKLDYYWIISNGKLNCLVYYYKINNINVKEDNYITCEPAFYNYKNIIEYLIKLGCKLNEWTIICAVWGNNFELFKWLHEINCPWNSKIYIYANLNDININIIKYAFNNNCPYNDYIFNKYIKDYI